jgi:hypothetical protein
MRCQSISHLALCSRYLDKSLKALQSTENISPWMPLDTSLVSRPRFIRSTTPPFDTMSFTMAEYEACSFEVCLTVFTTLKLLDMVSELNEAQKPITALLQSVLRRSSLY